jgi:hypothetical protein
VINCIHVLIAGILTVEGFDAHVAFVSLAMHGAVAQMLAEVANGREVTLTIWTVRHVCG